MLVRRDLPLKVAGALAALFVFCFLGLILFEVFKKGYSSISLSFLMDAPLDAGREGGIFPILQSTFFILMVCFSVVLPLGTITAYVLSEFLAPKSFLAMLLGLSLDLFAGMPSIVFGLFGLFFFGDVLGFGFSILSGGLTLALMVLPFYTRSVEDGLRLVPRHCRDGAAALALSSSSTFFHVILPLSLPSIVVGFILGVSRALAETAALLFTSGYVTRSPESLLDSGRALSVHIYDLAMNVPGGDKKAFGSVLVLMVLLLLIFQTTKFLGSYFQSRLLGVLSSAP